MKDNIHISMQWYRSIVNFQLVWNFDRIQKDIRTWRDKLYRSICYYIDKLQLCYLDFYSKLQL